MRALRRRVNVAGVAVTVATLTVPSPVG